MTSQNNQTKRLLAVTLNLAVFLISVSCALENVLRTGQDPGFGSNGLYTFRFFTTDSNLLCGFFALAAAVFLLKNRERALSERLALLLFVGAAAVTVTFLVVFCFLSFLVGGVAPLLKGTNLWLHLINPLLALAAFYLFDPLPPAPPAKDALLGALPVILYGAIYFTQVVVRSAWPDFYGFNTGGYWYISVVCMLLFGILLSLALRGLWKRKVKTE